MTETTEVGLLARTRRAIHPVVFPLVTGAAGAGALVVLSRVNPHEPGHYPTCPSLWLTGLYCPGCGSLRALHDLTHLDLVGAWDMNPLAVIAVPWLAWRWLRWLLETLGVRRERRLAPPWVLWTVFAVVVLFTILRNIPFFSPYLAP